MEKHERPSWVNTLITVLIVIMVFSIILSLLGFGTGMMGGMMGFGGLGMLLPIVLIIILLYGLSGREIFSPPRQIYYRDESAMEALERRYANGEISREEYLRIKKDITKS